MWPSAGTCLAQNCMLCFPCVVAQYMYICDKSTIQVHCSASNHPIAPITPQSRYISQTQFIAMTQCQMGHGLTMVCICGKKSDEEPGRHHHHTSPSSGPVCTAAGACSQLWPWGRGATWRQVELQHSQAEESWKLLTLQLCSLPGPRAAAPQKC